MATEDGAPAPAQAQTGGGASKADPKSQSKEQAAAQQTDGAPAGEKKLSGAELKKRAKEEKAARRAAAKAVQTSQAPQGGAATAGAQQAASGDGKGTGAGGSGKGKAKQEGQQSHGQQQQQHGKGGAGASTGAAATPKESKPAVPECFSHLSMARDRDLVHADKDVHPAVLVLGQHMSTFAISDSINRLEATLLAFKKVIDSYTTPHGTTLSRHFTSHVLNPQIEYLTSCRPMCFSMGNAIRWLKLQVSKIDIDLPDFDAKKLLCEAINAFINERITVADMVIAGTAAEMITDDEVIMTYARHHLVERALLEAKQGGKAFSVIVVDDPFDRVGIEHARVLSEAGILTTYAPDLGALRSNLQECTSVLVAADGMFSNGAAYARAGTCDIATVATDLSVRVVTLCESINFTERVSIDSLTYNEIDPERNTEGGFRLLFDTTRDDFISVVVTELGNASAASVPAVLRKLEDL